MTHEKRKLYVTLVSSVFDNMYYIIINKCSSDHSETPSENVKFVLANDFSEFVDSKVFFTNLRTVSGLLWLLVLELHSTIFYYRNFSQQKPTNKEVFYRKNTFRSDVHDMNVRSRILFAIPFQSFKDRFSYDVAKYVNIFATNLKIKYKKRFMG